MKLDEYQSLSTRTMSKDQSNKDSLTNYCMGLSGETGELVDYFKKVLFHQHPLDRERVISEAGDVLWYIAAIASELGIPLSEIAESNIEKLKKRYPEGFNPEQSINRI